MALITLEDLCQFHNIDRQIFHRLVIRLARNPGESLLVMALWLWLEEKGYPNVVAKMLGHADFVVNAMAEEAAECLRVLSERAPPVQESGGMSLTTSIMRTTLSLEMIYQIRFTAIGEIKTFLKNVCALVFTDILQRVLPSPSNPLNSNLPLVVPGFPHPTFGGLTIIPQPLNSYMPTRGLWGWSLGIDVPVDDRTMFLTFSRGYPVTESEIRELFNGHFGSDCVDSVWIHEFSTSDHPLFARMSVREVLSVDRILNGHTIAKFRINGKHVWARKFERRDNT